MHCYFSHWIKPVVSTLLPFRCIGLQLSFAMLRTLYSPTMKTFYWDSLFSAKHWRYLKLNPPPKKSWKFNIPEEHYKVAYYSCTSVLPLVDFCGNLLSLRYWFHAQQVITFSNSSMHCQVSMVGGKSDGIDSWSHGANQLLRWSWSALRQLFKSEAPQSLLSLNVNVTSYLLISPSLWFTM